MRHLLRAFASCSKIPDARIRIKILKGAKPADLPLE